MSDDPSHQQSGVDEQKSLGSASGNLSQADIEAQKSAEEIEKSEDTGDKATMRVKVYSPFRDYYDGQAFSLSAENLTGPFDILPKHHNFITLLSACEIIVRTVQNQEAPVHIRISGGILHVKSDEVLVFLDV